MPYTTPANIENHENYASCRYEASGTLNCKASEPMMTMTCGSMQQGMSIANVVEEFVNDRSKAPRGPKGHPASHASTRAHEAVARANARRSAVPELPAEIESFQNSSQYAAY